MNSLTLEITKDSDLEEVVQNLLIAFSIENMQKAIEIFGEEEILSELLKIYYHGSYNKKKEIISLCKDAFLVNKNKRPIKTIGTFYFRMANGGIERVLSKLMPIWIALGYKVVLFTEEPPSELDYEYPKEVVRVVIPKIKDGTKAEYRERIQCWQEAIAKYEIDVIVYHAWLFAYLFLDLLAIKRMETTFIVHTHGIFPIGMQSASASYAQNRILTNSVYGLADSILALTKLDYVWWSLQLNNVYQVLNPPSLDIRSTKVSDLENKNIIWLGRISPEKRPLDALKIMKRVVDLGCDAKLHLVGKAENAVYEQKIKDAAINMNLKEHVIFHGFHTDVVPFLQKASVYLHTSEYEGFATSIIESKICGLPAVIYDLPNFDIRRGMHIVKQEDVEEAAQSIVMLLNDAERRKEMGYEARKSVEEVYSVDLGQLWERIFCGEKADRIDINDPHDKDYVRAAVQTLLNFSVVGIDVRDSIKRQLEVKLKQTDEELKQTNVKLKQTNVKLKQTNVKLKQTDEELKQTNVKLKQTDEELKKIYNMRTWKLIQKYRRFMDKTLLGRALKKIRDMVLPKR